MDHISGIVQINELFYSNHTSTTISTALNSIEAVKAHINSLLDSESIKDFINKIRQKIKAIGSIYSHIYCYLYLLTYSLTYSLTYPLDDIFQKKAQQQLSNEQARYITSIKQKVMYVTSSLDSLEDAWNRVLPITDYIYTLKLYIYNPILELLETKQGIHDIESLRDSDNIYTKHEDAVVVYQELKKKKYNKYSDDFERLKSECQRIYESLELLPEWVWMKGIVNKMIRNNDIYPFLSVLSPVCNGNMLPYFLTKDKVIIKQNMLLTAIKQLETHVENNNKVSIDYEYITALLTDFCERVTALQIILHSKDFLTMHKEQSILLADALAHLKECEINVTNFNLMKKEYGLWMADMKKMIEEIIFTEFSYRINLKI